MLPAGSDSDQISALGSESGFSSGWSSQGVALVSGGHTSDFRRGKLCRRLLELLEGMQAQAMVKRFRLHAYGAMAVLLALHVVCFAVAVSQVQTQRK